MRWSVLLSSDGGRVQSCEVKGCVGKGMMLYDGGLSILKYCVGLCGRVEQSGTACNEVERSADLSSRCLHWGRVMDDSCSELCKSVCQVLHKRIDEPWLTPQNAANMGEKADGMTHCRPETPENERRFSQQALFSSSTMHLATWQPGN